MQGLRALCDKYGILLIADEVMAGFGRTGEWFSVDHWKVVPDLISMAKGLTSAYVQLGAVGMRRQIADHFEKNVFYGGLTYNSHPLACAAALATIAVYEEDNLIENARDMGVLMRELLEDLEELVILRWARRATSVSLELSRWCETGKRANQWRRSMAHHPRCRRSGKYFPSGRSLHVRALEHVLHQSAAVHHGSRNARGVRDHR